MRVVFLRRRKLGLTSCREIGRHMAEILKVPVVIMRNDKMLPLQEDDVLIRWGCTSSLLPSVWHRSLSLNPVAAIHWCNDKAGSRMSLQARGVRTPVSWWEAEFERDTEGHSVPGDTYVLRPPTHSQGRHLYHGNRGYICNKIRERRSLGLEAGYVSEYINKIAEYRVMVVAGLAVWVVRKTPANPEDIAWNVARGGRFDNVRWGEWPIAVVYEALRAAYESCTDFCGVDVMVDAEGTPYVLEVNSAPSHTSPYRQQATAKALAHLIQTQVTYPVPNGEALTWRDVIHPALLDQQ